MGEADPEQIVLKYMLGLQGDISSLITSIKEEQSQRIRELESELDRSETIIDYFRSQQEKVKNDFNKEREELQCQINKEKDDHNKDIQMIQGLDRRVICLIDGDGTIFSLSLVAKGQAGGRIAAAKLTKAIQEFMPNSQYQLHVWSFFNKHGLVETLRKHGKEEARKGFEQFVLGFTQAAERFLMVDIGSGKEVVDAKIKVYLEDEAKSLQTTNVIFGGCHDNGYMNTLRSIITAGYQSKLILLPGYKDMAAGFQSLDLPVLEIHDLFEPEKLCIPVAKVPSPVVSSSLSVACKGNASTFTSIPANTAPMCYKSAVQSSPPSPLQGLGPFRRRSSPPTYKSRHIDPNKSLSKQDPPPCNVFYLTKNCKFGASCTFGHDYLLKPEHIETLRENAKKSPCALLNRGEGCPYGDSCCYGHKCQLSTKCHFYKMGTCKFAAAGMHAD